MSTVYPYNGVHVVHAVIISERKISLACLPPFYGIRWHLNARSINCGWKNATQ